MKEETVRSDISDVKNNIETIVAIQTHLLRAYAMECKYRKNRFFSLLTVLPITSIAIGNSITSKLSSMIGNSLIRKENNVLLLRDNCPKGLVERIHEMMILWIKAVERLKYIAELSIQINRLSQTNSPLNSYIKDSAEQCIEDHKNNLLNYINRINMGLLKIPGIVNAELSVNGDIMSAIDGITKQINPVFMGNSISSFKHLKNDCRREMLTVAKEINSFSGELLKSIEQTSIMVENILKY